MKYFHLVLLLCLFLLSCNNDPVAPPVTINTSYTKINSVERGNIKFDIYSKSGNSMLYGYNKIGFKVFVSGVEMNSGYVKFFPKMYHAPGSPMHSSPAPEKYFYNSSEGIFTGYICFTMVSDSSSFWYGFYNYNETSRIDSVLFTVNSYSSNQVLVWDDIVSQHTYVLSLIDPMTPKVGLNDFMCILHRTNDDIHYTEVDSANYSIRTWMPAMGHGSSNNVNPVWQGGAIYRGKANLTMAGLWWVYNIIEYNGIQITGSDSKFIFQVQ
jgi:hypothetical protein